MAFAPTLRRAAASAPTSAFASNFATQRAVAGFTLPSAVRTGTLAASFGVFAGAAALFMLGEQLPFLDTYYDRPIAPEDNPF
ncbi:uncharacterized protein N7469_001182 [Penicillium citrinum]|uniref:Cytochrome b-c1 complex subunit 10 n=1 Tax=Penicillium citrinum TaxID=5077 RepID=A0A9W9PE27_PENCI|nr:uncharacterized protein N7469_001182 [Penicillium citrinum]KAJ5242855.1 hypothetical protein N7469_001182 [Penicillium citrinum]